MAREVRATGIKKGDLTGLRLDEADHRNLQNLMRLYEKAFPGQIAWIAKDSRRDIVVERKLRGAKATKGVQRRVSMPKDFYTELKDGYPAIFSDKNQMEQFLKWFPVFDMEQK